MKKKTSGIELRVIPESDSILRSIRLLVDELRSAQENPAVNLSTLLGGCERVRVSWAELFPGIIKDYDQILEQARRKNADAPHRFEEMLISALRHQGFQVHGETGTILVEGIAVVQISEDRSRIQLNGKQLQEVSLEPVLASVKEEIDSLRKNTTPPSQFGEEILSAYRDEVRYEGIAVGSHVHLEKIHMRLAMMRQSRKFFRNPVARNYTDYSIAQLRCDLFELMKSDFIPKDGYRLRFSSGSHIDGALYMLVPALARPGYIGRINFEK